MASLGDVLQLRPVRRDVQVDRVELRRQIPILERKLAAERHVQQHPQRPFLFFYFLF